MKIAVLRTKRTEKSLKKGQVKAFYLSKLSNKGSIKKVKSLISDILELDSLDALENYVISNVSNNKQYKRVKPVMISNISF